MKQQESEENQEEKIDMTILVQAMYFHMSNTRCTPKQMYMQCQQAAFFPAEIMRIVKADLSSRENGTLFEDILQEPETNFVFWNVALHKFLIKLTGMVGVANVALVIQNQINKVFHSSITFLHVLLALEYDIYF